MYDWCRQYQVCQYLTYTWMNYTRYWKYHTCMNVNYLYLYHPALQFFVMCVKGR